MTVPPSQAPGVAPATMANRFLARLVDGVIFLPVWLIILLISHSSPGLYFVLVLLLAVAAVGYQVYFTSTKGQTIGKKTIGIKVIDASSGGLLTQNKALIREVLLIIPCFGLYVAISPFFDKSGRQQGFHDKNVGSQVISAK